MVGYGFVLVDACVESEHSFSDHGAAVLEACLVLFVLVLLEINESVQGAHREVLHEVLVKSGRASISSFFQALKQFGQEVFFD